MGRAFCKIRSSDLGKGSPAATGDIVWLEMQHDTARRVRTFTYAVWAAAVTWCVTVGLLVPPRVAFHDRLRILAFFFEHSWPLWVLLWGLPYYRSLSWIPLSLGTDGRLFSLRGKNARVVESVPIDEVRTDGEFLLIGRRLVPLHHIDRAAYDMDRLRSEFIGRLPLGALVRRNALMWRAVRAGNHGLIILILIACIALCGKALI
jgi:hypothetical protein